MLDGWLAYQVVVVIEPRRTWAHSLIAHGYAQLPVDTVWLQQSPYLLSTPTTSRSERESLVAVASSSNITIELIGHLTEWAYQNCIKLQNFLFGLVSPRYMYENFSHFYPPWKTRQATIYWLDRKHGLSMVSQVGRLGEQKYATASEAARFRHQFESDANKVLEAIGSGLRH
jgi:hypothetical protein